MRWIATLAPSPLDGIERRGFMTSGLQVWVRSLRCVKFNPDSLPGLQRNGDAPVLGCCSPVPHICGVVS
jgi:hypothetical protein